MKKSILSLLAFLTITAQPHVLFGMKRTFDEITSSPILLPPILLESESDEELETNPFAKTKYSCCGKKFKTEQGLNNHWRHQCPQNSEREILVCDLCKKDGFNNPGNLELHKKYHCGENPDAIKLTCQFCNQNIKSRPDQLKKHEEKCEKKPVNIVKKRQETNDVIAMLLGNTPRKKK